MVTKKFAFSQASVHYYFDASLQMLHQLSPGKMILLVDEQVVKKHKKSLAAWPRIVVPSGEQFKTQTTADDIIRQLIALQADRQTMLVGVGGGVVTDITGYVAGIYKRGVPFGFVPTTLLAMTDAAIGGKNGVDVGAYKNMVGLIRQPQFILYDYSLLKSLPTDEWINGFAEIIKHACIADAAMFTMLEGQTIAFYKKDPTALGKLIMRNALLKTKTVIADEFENDQRKLLNFGHTVGHAVETLYNIPHGHAVSIGMGVACNIATQINGFKQGERVMKLLKQYQLPPQFAYDKAAIWKLLVADKKVAGDYIDYIVLDKIGKASIVRLPLQQLEALI